VFIAALIHCVLECSGLADQELLLEAASCGIFVHCGFPHKALSRHKMAAHWFEAVNVRGILLVGSVLGSALATIFLVQ
jgi:hypothetical protein